MQQQVHRESMFEKRKPVGWSEEWELEFFWLDRMTFGREDRKEQKNDRISPSRFFSSLLFLVAVAWLMALIVYVCVCVHKTFPVSQREGQSKETNKQLADGPISWRSSIDN